MESEEVQDKNRLAAENLELLELLLAEEGDFELAGPEKIQPRDEGAEAPLSFAQQRIWFLDQLQPGNPFYNIPAVLRIEGDFDEAVFEESLNEIIRRHESLRTAFVTSGGRAALRVEPAARLRPARVDLSRLAPREREAEALRLAAEEARRPFDLERSPLLRVTLLKLGERESLLLLTMHHIVSDAWSIGVFFRELRALYEAFSEGRPSPLPPLPIQYADFASWQRRPEQAAAMEEQLAYWTGRLDGAPEVLELPADHPRPPVESFRGDALVFDLDDRLADALRALGREEGATLFMTMLAAFKVLLYRYTGREDVVVGTPVANRNRSEVEGLIGFFLNNLVLRTDLSGGPTFREFLRRVREVCLDAYAHQDLPFERLVEELRPERNLSHNPIFQVFFALQNNAFSLDLPRLRMTLESVENQTSKFDLFLSLREREGGGVAARFEYSTDLFERETIARMARHFRRLLRAVAADPDAAVGALPLMGAAERRMVLRDWNSTAADFPTEDLATLFERQADRTPDAPALWFAGGEVSYRELDERANRLARHLRRLGVGGEQAVGVCMPRSEEMVVAVLAVLKAGGAYVPLDASYPAERLRLMVEDAGARVVVGSRAATGWCEGRARVVDLWEERAAIEAEDARRVERDEWDDRRLAYVIYTSGSTGRPKGVAMTQRCLANLVAWQLRDTKLRHPARTMQFASLSFDVSAQEIFTAWYSGATLVLITEELRRDPSRLLRLVRDERVERLFLPFVALRQLAEVAAAEGELPRHLREVISAGEQLLITDHVATFFGRLEGCTLYNQYGPSESHIITSSRLPPEPSTWAPLPPIGAPVANTQIYILDALMQPAPVGVPGELYIGGANLARGYVNRPALTAERFVPDPFDAEGGGRLYRSGDSARFLPDGNIEFLGRLDQQVKIRGFRIEPGEIEAALASHAAVREAVVVVRGAGAEKRLIGYVVPQEGAGVTASELRNHLKQTLPEYMIPSAFAVTASLPLTPSGKVDRRLLPDIDGSRPELEGSFAAPRNAAEQALAQIWAEILRLERVGINDNFFELGGDSILTIQVITRAKERGLHLTPKQMFQHQTVAELAAVAGLIAAAENEQGAVTGEVPLTPVQRWFFEKITADTHHWNMSFPLEAREPLDVPALARAVQEILLHHDALRMRFTEGGGGWRQRNEGPGGEAPFSHLDLSSLAEDEALRQMEAHAVGLQASLDLERGPLVRVALYDLGPAKPSCLLVIIHHLVVDGVSWRILLEDLQTAYRAAARGDAVVLPPKTASFKRWAGLLSEHAQTAALRSELDYWMSEPRKRARPIPLDRSSGANTQESARTVSATLDEEETRALLQEVPKAYNVQINDVLLTALAEAFSRRTGERSLLISLEGHGREEIFEGVDISRTVGWFTSIFPVLLDLGDPSTPAAALRSVKEQLRAIPNRGVGYGLLRYLHADAEVRAGLRSMPQPDVSFNYLGQFDQVLSGAFASGMGKYPVGSGLGPRGPRLSLIYVYGIVYQGRLHVHLNYSENFHDRSTAEALVQGFVAALRALIAGRMGKEVIYTPSDFPKAKLKQKDVDKLMEKIRRPGARRLT